MKLLIVAILMTVTTAVPKQLTGDFVLVRTSPMLHGEQRLHGKLTYKAPDYVRWEYTSPEKAVYEMNGKKDNLSPQVKRLMELINQCIDGSENVRDFKVSTQRNVTTMEPVRRDLRRTIEKIVVTKREDGQTVRCVEISESNGGKITINFTNVKAVW